MVNKNDRAYLGTLGLDSECADVGAFHEKFNQIAPVHITHITQRKLAERIRFLAEELAELAEAGGLEEYAHLIKKAVENKEPQTVPGQNMELMFDALIDLTYVAKGTIEMMGLGVAWVEGWDDVQRANMAKELGQTHRGNAMDVRKPEGWIGPQTSTILIKYGYRAEGFMTNGIIDESKCLDDEVHTEKN